jgi:hypothetical protein
MGAAALDVRGWPASPVTRRGEALDVRGGRSMAFSGSASPSSRGHPRSGGGRHVAVVGPA